MEENRLLSVPEEQEEEQEEAQERSAGHYALWGGVLMILSLFIGLSGVSYAVSGALDQSFVQAFVYEGRWPVEEKVHNWFGLLGAFTGYYLLHESFGLGSLLTVPIFLLLGAQLFWGRTFFSLSRTTLLCSFFLLWSSLSVGYLELRRSLVPDRYALYGKMGWEGAQLLDHVMGVGTYLFLPTVLLVFLFYFFKLTRFLPTWKPHPPKPSPMEGPEETSLAEDPVSNAPFQRTENTTLETSTVNTEAFAEDDKHDESLDGPVPNRDQEVAEAIEETRRAVEEEDKSKAHGGHAEVVPQRPVYAVPSIDLLRKPEKNRRLTSEEELEVKKQRIQKTLSDFGVNISQEHGIRCTVGPTVTLYEMVPDAGVKIARIRNLEDDLALNLKALGIRIIAPMPGKGTIGVEVPNEHRELTPIRSALASEEFSSSQAALPLVIGKSITNKMVVADLTEMPHLLMAGATGQGKSVGLNTMLVSLLYKKHPDELKMVLIDPKKVELSLFSVIERHFLAKIPGEEVEAIVTDTQKAVHILDSLCKEMDTRYDKLKEAGCRNIKEYNSKIKTGRLRKPQSKALPYMVLVIDELADLMMTTGKEVEKYIARLAQLARAVGIHLVVATQRPSVDVITGVIKANFPARLSYKVSTKVDSRTILDAGGADQLVGKGDLLFSSGSDIVRLQCPYVDTEEVEKICNFVARQNYDHDAYLLPEPDTAQDDRAKSADHQPKDPLFEEAAYLIAQTQQGSTSLIQRRMNLGFNRAARIMEQMERYGIVGPSKGSKPREVKIHDEIALKQFLETLD